MNEVRISVAMTTFNGEKYILPQLLSILAQTRLPDEVIICDDQSTDKTAQLINAFINEHKLNNWYFFVNEERLGWKANFFEVIKKTTGDIIFFADQDDIWHKDKIARMSDLMQENNMGCLFGMKRYIDSNGNFLQDRMDKNSFSNKIHQIQFNQSFFAYKTLGCCMCISKEVAKKYLKLSATNVCHDSQVARLALLFSTAWELDSPVIDYRVHSNNASGIRADRSYGTSILQKRIQEIKETIKWLEDIDSTFQLDYSKKYIISNCINAEIVRLNYLTGKGGTVFNLFFIRKYYRNLSMLVGDFAYKHNINTFLGEIRWTFRKE